ncbi:MAG: hypothetical protein HDT01_05950 [Bacteroidales bacterium]|nr:hypothetical protein [Bacteroidales bacterium]
MTPAELKKELKITRVNHHFQGECIQLNMPIKLIIDTLSPDDDDFYQNLSDAGITLDAPILASPQDVEDYRTLDSVGWETDSDNEEEYRASERRRAIYNRLSNLVYEDTEFTDPETGLKGLLNQFGDVIVPAKFDSCEGITCILDDDRYAIVEKDGKFYRTPRSGSGILIDQEGYDKIYLNGFVIRNGKYGKLSLTTPEVIIPCEMDWISYDAVWTILFGKDGKIGLYDTYLDRFLEPEYSAYDITTLQFNRDGVWGWVSRQTLEFFTTTSKHEVPIGNRYDVIIAGADADSFLDYDDKPKSLKDSRYFTPDELKKQLHKDMVRFKKGFKVKLSSLQNLRDLKFRKEFKIPASLVEAVRSLSTDGNRLTISCKNEDVAEINVTLLKKNDADIYKLEWSPKNNALAWYDAELPLIDSFHQYILSGKDSFLLKFSRSFMSWDIKTLARFIGYYYKWIWDISVEELNLEITHSKEPD